MPLQLPIAIYLNLQGLPQRIGVRNRFKLYNLKIASFGVTCNLISHRKKQPEPFAVKSYLNLKQYVKL